MSQTHPNVLTYVAAIDAFNRDDVEGVAEHVRAYFVYRIPGRSLIAGEFHGVAGFVDGMVADGQVFLSDPEQVDDCWVGS